MSLSGRRLWVGVASGFFAGLCVAGTGSGIFAVSIALSGPLPVGGGGGVSTDAPRADATIPGVCISEVMGEFSGARVRVTCDTGRFVSIGPLPGRPFLGAHGGAFRYNFIGGNSLNGRLPGAGRSPTSAGTVTSVPVSSVVDSGTALEMLVSF